MSDRRRRHDSTGPARADCSTVFTARSAATQAMTLEWVKCRRGPRTSQMPSSGRSHAVSTKATKASSRRHPGFLRLQAEAAGLVHHIEHLAIDIELELAGGRVADPHRAGAVV